MSDIVKRENTNISPHMKRELIIKLYTQIGKTVFSTPQSRLNFITDYVKNVMTNSEINNEWKFITSGNVVRLLNTMKSLQSGPASKRADLVKAFQMLQRSVSEGIQKYKEEGKEIDDETFQFVENAVMEYVSNLEREVLGISNQQQIEAQNKKLIEKKNPVKNTMKTKFMVMRNNPGKKLKTKSNPSEAPTHVVKLYARPYDIDANGFYFKSIEEYRAKASKNRNPSGSLVEEYEFQFIDGDEFFDGQKVLDILGLEKFFEVSDGWKKSDIQRLEIAIESLGSSYFRRDLDEIRDIIEDSIIYEGENFDDLTYGMFEDYYEKLKDLLAENQAIDWFDYEAFVKANFNDGEFFRWNGKAIYFEYNK